MSMIMRRFKNRNNSFTADQTGEYSYQVFSPLGTGIVVVPSQLIEDSLDWEELKEQPVICKTYDGVNLFIGDTYYVPQRPGENYLNFICGFTLFDNITASNKHSKIFSTREAAQKFLDRVLAYTTKDGEHIKEEQKFFVYDDVNFKCLPGTYGGFVNKKYNGKRFKTEAEVKLLIALNKPQYSLNQVHKAVNHWAMSPLYNSDISNFLNKACK